MRIYNSLTSKKEKLSKRGIKKLFVCGPTVYDYSHIGHARTYLAFDIIVRYLRSQNWKIDYIQNITDIDDKIIERAKESGKNFKDISSEFERAYYEDMNRLGITTVDRYAKASNFIAEIIKQIEILIDKGFAYETENGVYFEIKKFKDYGKLSGQNLDKLRPGYRIESDEHKKDPLDFSLWKFSKENGAFDEARVMEASWPSPWGQGRPGWHIEDTAISYEIFGPQYDLHGGAEELKFPHHEAEIAQAEAAYGKKPFVKIWMHTGILQIEGEKMSKSLKNFITIRDFLKEYSSEVLRWMIFSSHYRSRVNYTESLAKQSLESINTIKKFVEKLRFIEINSDNKSSDPSVKKLIADNKNGFHSAMEDDLNTPKSSAVIFEFINSIQDNIWGLKKRDAGVAREHIEGLLKIIGLEFPESEAPTRVKALVEKREQLRTNQQFMQSDELREKIKDLGYEVEDTPIGPFVKETNKSNSKY